MATDVFKESRKALPKSSSVIVRVAFDENELGARKTLLPKSLGKNDNNIQHVK